MKNSSASEFEATDRAAGGIQSLDAALKLLKCLAKSGQAMTLTELARAAAMPPTKAHRYLSSFVAAGLVEQRERSGRYDLGPEALTLGLSALARTDSVNRTADALPGLVGETGMTALLSVWGDQGPTVVRWERAASVFVTSLGLGTTLPLLNSATGRICVAYLPEAVTAARIDQEMRAARSRRDAFCDLTLTSGGIRSLADAVRAAGFASVDGRFIPGLAAIAAPVLDWQGYAVCVVTLIGTDAAITAPESAEVRALAAFCRGLSTEQPGP
ncbi:MAG: IclR family transcriptional regulator [Pseudomonadota bacterium]